MSVAIKEAAAPFIKTAIKESFNICPQHARLIAHNSSIQEAAASTSGPLMRLNALPRAAVAFTGMTSSSLLPAPQMLILRNDLKLYVCMLGTVFLL